MPDDDTQTQSDTTTVQLREVQVPPDLPPEVRALVDGLLDDRKKLAGSLEKSTTEAKGLKKTVRESKLTALQAKYPALKPEMLEHVAMDKWDDTVKMWAEAFGGGQTPPAGPTSGDGAGGVQQVVTQQTAAQQTAAPAINPQTGQPVPETSNVISPAAAQKFAEFMASIGQGGQGTVSTGPMTFEEMEAKVASGQLKREDAQAMVEKGLVTGMPPVSTKGGRLVIGG